MSLPPLTPDQLVKPRHFELRIALLFAALYIPAGIHLPYFPLWLAEAGFGPGEIAVILSAPMFLRVLTTPLITAYADKASDRANVLLGLVAVSVMASLGYFLTPAYGVVLGVSLVLAIVWTPHAPLTDSLALSGVRRFGCDYSRMRVWGSAAFFIANFAGGLVLASTGAGSVPVMITAGLALTLVAALFAPRLGRPRLPSPLSAASLQDAGPALFSRRFMLFAVGAGLVAASHALVYSFGSIYWRSIGISEAMVGLLWAWAVVAEVAVFAAFPRLFARSTAGGLLTMAGIAAVIRWTAFPLIWPIGLDVAGFLVAQSLHGFSTGLVLLGVQKMIAETVPDHRFGAAIGVAFFANGFCMAALTLVSGSIYAQMGPDGFYIMALVAALGLCLVLLARRSAPERRLGR
jgi:PPP family 3-phenylpropionic acid transporter